MEKQMGGDDEVMTRAMFGQHAAHIPAWMWVQHAGNEGGFDIVQFVGASRVPQAAHPLRYGSAMTHQFMLGEIIVRPHLVFETNHRQGEGLASLATAGADVGGLVEHGNLIVDALGKAGLRKG